MRLWTQITLFAVSLLILSGCGARPKPKDEVVIDSTLPIVELTKNGAFVDMNAIAFEWKSIKDQRVEGVYVYKLTPESKDELYSYYKSIPNRFVTHFVDADIKPDTKYSYFFKTYTKEAESLQSKKVILNSLPVLQSVSWIHSIQNMPRSAKIIWRPHVNQKVSSYAIERKLSQDDEWDEIARIDGRLNAEYIDEELKDNYTYMYRIKVETFDNIVSTPSQMVKVITKPLPTSIADISATKNLPKEIKLNWESSDIDDFSRYQVYRSKSKDGSYDLIAKLQSNIFVDKCEEDGIQYFYRISVVDKDGLESEFNTHTADGSTLSKPETPVQIKTSTLNGKVKVTWENSDPRVKSYIVEKKYKKSFMNYSTKEFSDIQEREFTDDNIELSKTYYYLVYSVDKNAIKSEPSVEVKVEYTKVQKIKAEIKSLKLQNIEKENIVIPAKDLKLNEI